MRLLPGGGSPARGRALQACSGSFEKVQNTIIVIAGGPCQAYSGRWVLLDGIPPASSARREQVFPFFGK